MKHLAIYQNLLADEIVDTENMDEEMEKYIEEEFQADKMSDSLKNSMVIRRRRKSSFIGDISKYED